eukprot:gnl/MRDRNA2_/MRDRNA2_89839_c0_seq1.p1 gnl/MRDRNA2_/MRDRNA2_89839_c0~~gnl/MRDRNA2_/MRDRNA2_89839_c0_seq1.p1  ORF type:complete len:514 (+),score=87.18 gnl/MRDRNA2_/MRDRNA2_89839_c0_seq1:89-1630(+)
MHVTLAIAPLILTLGSLAPTMCEVNQAIEFGGCLLAHRTLTFSKSSSMQTNRHRLNEQITRHHSWGLEHHKLERAANESQGALERFINGQAKSDDACSARLMEAKRALDGLLHDLHSLTQQVKSHEDVVKTETENLNITHLAIDSLEEQFKEDMELCKEDQEQARADRQDLEQELQELIQIAQPEVRYEHVSTSASSLLETDQSLWDVAQCQAFVKLVTKGALFTSAPPRNMSCDRQRSELQESYTDAVNSVRNLMKDAKDREMDTTCKNTAAAKKTAEKIPLVGQRDKAAERISSSAQAITLLEPVINMVRNRAEAMEKHIEDTLKPECEEVAHVSEALGTIRNLIISLEKCPGRNDFKLKIPKEADSDSSAASEGAKVAVKSASIATTSTASTTTTTKQATSSTAKVTLPTTPKQTSTTPMPTTTTTSTTVTTVTTTSTKSTTVSTTVTSTSASTSMPTTSAAATTTTMTIHGPEEPIHGFGGLIPEDEVSAMQSRADSDNDMASNWSSEW